jgi:hypothetical protein
MPRKRRALPNPAQENPLVDDLILIGVALAGAGAVAWGVSALMGSSSSSTGSTGATGGKTGKGGKTGGTTPSKGSASGISVVTSAGNAPLPGSIVQAQIQSEANAKANGMQYVRGQTLTAGQSLAAGQSMWTADGSYHLDMQHDGNLVLYQGPSNNPSNSVWSTNTQGSGAVTANMQADGNFVLYLVPGSTSPGESIWATNSVNNDSGSYLLLGGSSTEGPSIVLMNSQGITYWANG